MSFDMYLRVGHAHGSVVNSATALFVLWGGLAAVPPAARGGTCTNTPSQTEGPYYRVPTPETNNLVIGSDRPLLTLNGQVVDASCNPIPYTWLDIWHANPGGAYDNTAPYDQYRGHLYTDANGGFTVRTILPGLYPGRTRHTHVKVDAANTAVLTTQLYFPNEPQNGTDSLYNPALEIDMVSAPGGGYTGSFVFVLTTTASCTAPTVTDDPDLFTATQGTTATFTILATGGTPMTYRWSRNGVPLENDARITGVTTNTLRLASVTCADSGTYECAALNSCGADASAAASLVVTGCCTGDLNGDGYADGHDIGPFINCVMSGGGIQCACADLSGNGAPGAEDVPLFASLLLQ